MAAKAELLDAEAAKNGDLDFEDVTQSPEVDCDQMRMWLKDIVDISRSLRGRPAFALGTRRPQDSTSHENSAKIKII